MTVCCSDSPKLTCHLSDHLIQIKLNDKRFGKMDALKKKKKNSKSCKNIFVALQKDKKNTFKGAMCKDLIV